MGSPRACAALDIADAAFNDAAAMQFSQLDVVDELASRR